jgi:hypothetical protein
MTRNTQKRGKFEMHICRTWNMERKLKIMENEKHTVGREMYWLVLCQLDTAGVITEKGASVEEMPP